MAEILGIGLSHGPHPGLTDETMANVYFRHNLLDEKTPPVWKDPSNWPEALKREWGDDEGITAARLHREQLVEAYGQARKAIDAFNPDYIVIFGDDQYEVFKEDVLPPFCVYGLDEYDMYSRSAEPRGGAPRGVNMGVRMERPRGQQSVKGSKRIGTFLADELVNRGFDVACSWKLPHRDTLGHAFTNTVDYLDWDRSGFPYTIVPFHVSCYGKDLRVPTPEAEEVIGKTMRGVAVAPPASPPPWRCYDLGKALSEAIAESSDRVVIVGSASWSHGSLTDMHGFLWGDVESDIRHYEQLKENEFAKWREIDTDEMRGSGQHEMRNWICLAGAMEGRKAEVLTWAESYIFNSSKCVAVFS